ncbi:MAG: ABC transporter permease [Turicibacter sp.]|nr:ABC transporter permease [Turicibacter sp.]
MNSTRLFLTRFKAESRFHLDTFTWVVPKLYWFYILGPYGFFAVALYRDFLEQPHAYWPKDWPFAILLGIGLLFLSFGSFRSYLLEADLLNIIQNQKVVTGLRRLGRLMSTTLAILPATAVTVLLLPFLGAGDEILPLFLMLFAYKLVGMYIHQRFIYHWLGKFLSVALFAAVMYLFTLGALAYGVASVAAILFILILSHQKLGQNSGFSREISVELKEKHRYVGWIFLASSFKSEGVPSFERSPLSKSNQPGILFANSRPIFKERSQENVFLEFSLKSFLRNPADRGAYLKVVFFPAAIMFALPQVAQIILLVVILIALWLFADGAFQKIAAHEFFYLAPVSKEIHEAVSSRFCLYLVIPGIGVNAIAWYLSSFI